MFAWKTVFTGAFCGFLIFTTPIFAVPPVVERTFAEKYPDAEAEKWEQDAHGYWETKFRAGEIKFRADFNEDGSWVETENSIEFDKLPSAVQEAIKREFPDETITEIESVDNASRGRFFDVEFKRPGKNMDIEYHEDGTQVESTGDVGGATGEVGQAFMDLLFSPPQVRQLDARELSPIEIFSHLGINLIVILIYAWGIFYQRHRDHQMFFLLLGFNLFLFPVIVVSSGFTAGAGLTIFAMLAMVRLRSYSLSKTEVAYLLGAVALTFINALLTFRVSMPASVIVLLTAWLADHPRFWQNALQRVSIRYLVDDPSRSLDREYLGEQLSKDFQIEVDHVEIESVQKKEIRLVVMYREKENKEEPKRG